MKFSLNIGKLSQANVWLHDLPAAGFEGEKVTETFLSAATIPQVRRAALELFVPVGGRIIYGLLGGILIPANPEVLKIEIHTSEDRSTCFNEAMVKSERVFAGLPREYVPGIQRALAVSEKYVQRVSAGHLSLTYAAHGEVTSNAAIFGQLTIGLLKLFSFETIRPAEDELVKIFPKRLADEVS